MLTCEALESKRGRCPASQNVKLVAQASVRIASLSELTLIVDGNTMEQVELAGTRTRLAPLHEILAVL